MSGRFTLRSFPASFAELLGVTVAPEFDPDSAPRFNIAPTQPIAVACKTSGPFSMEVAGQAGNHQLIPMLWGLVPHWSSDMPKNGGWFNARAETVFEKPAFRAAAKYRRCLIPADGFYVWRTTGDEKRPYLFERPTGEPFCFAGIWDHWTAADGSERDGAAILTISRGRVAEVGGDRAPVIIPTESWTTWTHTSPERVEPLKRLLKPPRDDFLTSRVVSAVVNNVRNDDPECVLSPD